ncbi:MAG: sulfite exporter TauE/SafE family protein [Planctomycetes bacterium]|nr:sulfite exporter TauE/SafE family protein [Planctomycetota bacterium]
MTADALTVNLVLSAAAIAFVHTALGPDHTLPFVMLARARKWSLRRTLAITAACGLGHVLSSIVLGGLGGALGASTNALEGLETSRGAIAAWGMVVFGGVYALWGLRQALKRKHGLALHAHAGHVHLHRYGAHGHGDGVGHEHDAPRTTTFWTLFVIFALGPCEPLIPLFFLPASEGRWSLALVAATVFSLVTLATMLVLVGLAHAGVERLELQRLERWAHALAGGVIAGSGLAVLFLGL